MSSSSRRLSEERVSLRDAKAKLSHLTKQARDGGRVVITSHGTPIADLVPHGTGKPRLLRLKRPGRLPKAARLAGRGPEAATILLKDRAT